MSSRKPRGKHARPPSRHLSRTTYALAGTTVIVATPLVGAVSAGAAEPAAIAGTGSVTMVHAVPGLVADISVDGKEVLKDFTASRVTDPVTLSAGPHTVAVKADNGPSAGKTVLTATLDIAAGSTSTAVAGLAPDGSPKAFLFPETAQPVPNGKAGVVIRTVGATGPVTMVVDGAPLPTSLPSGGSFTADLAPGAHSVLVRDTSTGAVVLAAQSAPLQADRVTTLYLTGSAKDKTLSWVATTRLASSVVPLNTVPTGDGSTASTFVTTRDSVDLGAAAGLAGAAGLATFAVLRRRARPGTATADERAHAEA